MIAMIFRLSGNAGNECHRDSIPAASPPKNGRMLFTVKLSSITAFSGCDVDLHIRGRRQSAVRPITHIL